MNLLNRITENPNQCGGRPCIRRMRIRVSDILEMMAENVSNAKILEDFPDLEPEDLQACLLYTVLKEGDYLKVKEQLFAQETVASLYEKIKDFQDSNGNA